jgi:hypothetical protein
LGMWWLSVWDVVAHCWGCGGSVIWVGWHSARDVMAQCQECGLVKATGLYQTANAVVLSSNPASFPSSLLNGAINIRLCIISQSQGGRRLCPSKKRKKEKSDKAIWELKLRSFILPLLISQELNSSDIF